MLRPTLSLLLLLCAAVTTSTSAEDLPAWVTKTKLSGYFMADVYGVAAHHDPGIEGDNGLWFRRAYLTLDSKVNDATDVRFRLEANSPGDFSTSRNLEPYLKDLYLRWKHRGHEIYLGLSPAVTWEVIEAHWGYRHVEKAPQDLYRWGSSRDIGVAAKGALDGSGRVRYHLMLANGEGTRSETNSEKRAMASLSFQPTAAWIVEVYADTDQRVGQNDRMTWHAFAGYRGARGRVGAHYAAQERELGGDETLDLAIASVHGALSLDERFTALARVDRHIEPVPGASAIDYLSLAETAEPTLAILGLEVLLAEKVSLVPNVEAVFYEAVDGNAEPDPDVIGRLTLFVQW